MKAGYIDEISNWTGLEGLSAADYHAAAARARKLHAEATTPRLKQYLWKLITQFEGWLERFRRRRARGEQIPSKSMTGVAIIRIVRADPQLDSSSRRNRTRTSGAVKAAC